MVRADQVMAVKEVIVNAIYHGHHFSAHRDQVVIQKDVDRIFEIFGQPLPYEEVQDGSK